MAKGGVQVVLQRQRAPAGLCILGRGTFTYSRYPRLTFLQLIWDTGLVDHAMPTFSAWRAHATPRGDTARGRAWSEDGEARRRGGAEVRRCGGAEVQ